MTAKTAAYTAIACSLLSLIACLIFLPTIYRKLVEIQNDLEMVGGEFIFFFFLTR